MLNEHFYLKGMKSYLTFSSDQTLEDIYIRNVIIPVQSIVNDQPWISEVFGLFRGFIIDQAWLVVHVQSLQHGWGP